MKLLPDNKVYILLLIDDYDAHVWFVFTTRDEAEQFLVSERYERVKPDGVWRRDIGHIVRLVEEVVT